MAELVYALALGASSRKRLEVRVLSPAPKEIVPIDIGIHGTIMISEYYINILIFLLLFFVVFIVAELLYKNKTPQFITRKFVHISSALIVALSPFFIELKVLIIIGIVFSFILLWTKRKRLLNSVHEINYESVGALLFAPSIILTALIFWPINVVIFQGAMLVLGLADGVAGMVGIKYGRHKYKITGTKSVEGSLSFFLVTLLILFGIIYASGGVDIHNILYVLGGAFLLTIIEGIFSEGWDNIFISIASGAVLLWILSLL